MAKLYSQIEVSTTPQFTWVGSTAPSSLSLQVKTASSTIVGSVAAVSSGGGNWYAFMTIPDSFGNYPCYLLAEWTATASTHAGSASQFVNRMVFEVIKTAAYPQPQTC